MGVMACDRKGCRNIMCNRLSDDYGYICDHCFRDLEEVNPESIKMFMDGVIVEKEPVNYGDIFRLLYPFQ